ncbi:MAG: hypothetical protein ACE5HJ_07765 [Thermoplasmata archaeon]
MILFLLVLWMVGAVILVLLGPMVPLEPGVAALILQTYTFGIGAVALIWIGLRWAAKEVT